MPLLFLQEQVYQEIAEALQNKNFDYEVVSGMKYLNACIKENLRINGAVVMQTRVCTKDTEVNLPQAISV